MTDSSDNSKLRTIIDALLEEQSSLTAVERFSRAHDRCDLPAEKRHYSDLLPLTPPASGQQYAFEVDLDQCSGCKACVTACHSLNGLDDDESWRSVGLLYSDDWRQPFQQTVTTACHHCVDPGCLTGCPVLAYEKDPVTGIVQHLGDQCIGCQYCVMKCPYEVPQYSAERGIVRKCDMCSSRLAVGEAPACVQACPHEAIRITLVDQREVSVQFREDAASTSFLPASPAPDITVPTTRYKSAKPLSAGLLAGGHARVKPASPHLPLVFMLVLSQLSVGASLAAVFTSAAKWLSLTALGVGVAAVLLGSLHLGQPLKAWRAFMGWRTSWFSREIIALGIYLPLAALAAAAFWLAPLSNFQKPLTIAAAVAGLVGVACSAMIYADTHREFWSTSRSFGKFFGTTALLGGAMALTIGMISGTPMHREQTILALFLMITAGAKLGLENRIFRHLADEETAAPTPLNKTARLLEGQLGLVWRWRVLLALAGGVVLPLIFLTGNAAGSAVVPALLGVCVMGELMERYLFFTAVAPIKMPGGIAH